MTGNTALPLSGAELPKIGAAIGGMKQAFLNSVDPERKIEFHQTEPAPDDTTSVMCQGLSDDQFLSVSRALDCLNASPFCMKVETHLVYGRDSHRLDNRAC